MRRRIDSFPVDSGGPKPKRAKNRANLDANGPNLGLKYAQGVARNPPWAKLGGSQRLFATLGPWAWYEGWSG